MRGVVSRYATNPMSLLAKKISRRGLMPKGTIHGQGKLKNSSPESEDLHSLWEEAKAVELSEEERSEQRIINVAANGNITDERITVETTRAVHTLFEAEYNTSAKKEKICAS